MSGNDAVTARRGCLVVCLCGSRGEAQGLLAVLRDLHKATIDWASEVATLPDATRVLVVRSCPARMVGVYARCDVVVGRCPEHDNDAACRALHERMSHGCADATPLKDHRRVVDLSAVCWSSIGGVT